MNSGSVLTAEGHHPIPVKLHRYRSTALRCEAATTARKIKLSILSDDGFDVASECEMTKAKRAWRKANAYVRSGQHDKAIYWLSRTQAILDGDRPHRRRLRGIDTGYMLGALIVVAALWAAVS